MKKCSASPAAARSRCRLLCGPIAKVATCAEICGYSAPDVPLTSQPRTDPPSSPGCFCDWKNISPSECLPHSSPLSPPPSFTFTPIPTRPAPRSTPGGLRKILSTPMPREPATCQPITSPSLWSSPRVAQVTAECLFLIVLQNNDNNLNNRFYV